MGKGRYSFLNQLIELVEEFESEERKIDILSFSKWLNNKFEKEPELNKSYPGEKLPGYFNDSKPVLDNLNERARFIEVVSRIARFHEFYSRKALKDLVINTRLEFLILQLIDIMEKAKKTDLINIFNLEYTTGMDTIKRLTNNGLVNEIPDESDKRAKLLALTEKGELVLTQAHKRMSEENRIFLAAISDNKWKKALPALEEIDDFHSMVYQNYSDKSFAELNNLMDSLKYLHK